MGDTTNVLIIEDNPPDAYLQKAALRSVLPMEYKILWTSDLCSGCDAMRHEDFDVILLDLGLPETTGANTVRAIRLVNQRSAIVVLSGSDDQDVAREALALGAEDYLPKSLVTPQSLHRAIVYAIERKRQQEATLGQQALLEGQLAAVLDAAQDALVVCDPRGVVRSCSRKALQRYGWRPESVVGRSLTYLVRNPSAQEGWMTEMLAQAQTASDRRVGPTTLVVEDDLGRQQLADATIVAQAGAASAVYVCVLQPTDVGAR